jgi:hypothetical protein
MSRPEERTASELLSTLLGARLEPRDVPGARPGAYEFAVVRPSSPPGAVRSRPSPSKVTFSSGEPTGKSHFGSNIPQLLLATRLVSAEDPVMSPNSVPYALTASLSNPSIALAPPS